jgi:alpha-beta hydrolase superfamily lysophospholipase
MSLGLKRFLGGFHGAGWCGAVMVITLIACAPLQAPMGPEIAEPRLLDDRIVLSDGAELPLRRWLPSGTPQAVIVAVHGFNDYSNAFAMPGTAWAGAGIATYAYDQRGFGNAPRRGIWPGTKTLVSDVDAVTGLIAHRHPGIPTFVIGESMGAAVIMAAVAEGRLTQADGLILSAPAVRGRETIPLILRAAAWIVAHTVPWLAGQPPPNLGFRPSDNIEMLRALGRDPLVIKETRIDAGWGLLNLMDDALQAAPRFDRDALILLGARDNLIPDGPTTTMLARLPEENGRDRRIALYKAGYHMLLRDLQAPVVHGDVAHWVLSRRSGARVALPSGADAPETSAGEALSRRSDRL